MADIESAEELAREYVDHPNVVAALASRIRARDNATRLAVLEEITELFVVMVRDATKERDPIAAINGAGPTAIRLIRAKYTQPVEPGQESK